MPSLPETESKGSVSGSYSRPRGWDSAQQACARVMNEAIAGLLLKAEELGGNGIREMESRGSSQWSARPVCLLRPGAHPFADVTAAVRVRGLAVYDPGIESSGTAAEPPQLPGQPKDIEPESLLNKCLSGSSRSRRLEAKRKEVCADLNECLSGYSMSRRPEDMRNEMCTERLRRQHEDFDAVMGTL